MLRKTVKYLKTLERTEAKEELQETQRLWRWRHGTNLARSGTCGGREGRHFPQGDRQAEGNWGAVEITGGDAKYEVGRPNEKSQATIAS